MEQKWVNKLNNDEFSLIENDWYPLIKKSAIDKIKAQMVESGEQLQSLFPHESFKISAGERLQDLPYLVLDFPKINSPNFEFVCRTLFWWGRGIQFQVIFQGTQAEVYEKILKLAKPTDYILIGTNLWQNDLSNEDFKPLSQLSKINQVEVVSKTYFKMVRFNPIESKENLFDGLSEFFLQFKHLDH